LIYGLYDSAPPRRWWLYGWLASVPVIIAGLHRPVFIDPMFNHFEPLEAKQPRLLPEIEKVMQRGGLTIERSRMFEMQASDKVTTYNAYVTGIGASKRVVVWDNTSKDLTMPETLFVFGHEWATMCCIMCGS
jgi:Zn-dependent protease with chaperone function